MARELSCPSEKWCREADPALKALERSEQYWHQNDPSGLASLLVTRFAPLGVSGVWQIQDLEGGPESNSKFKLVSCKCTSKERFCLVSARLCQPPTIPLISRLPFGTPSGPGSATYVWDCCAHSAPLSYPGEKVWRQRGRGAFRINDPDFSRTKIVY